MASEAEIEAERDKHKPANIKIYRAKEGQIAINFDTPEQRDWFLKRIKITQIPEGFRHGPQYSSNPNGYSPFSYTHPKALFFPAYETKDKVIGDQVAINLGSKENRDAFIKALGYEKAIVIQDSSEGQKYYGQAPFLFTVFDNERNENTIYFIKNQVLTQYNGSYIHLELENPYTSIEVRKFEEFTQDLPPRSLLFINPISKPAPLKAVNPLEELNKACVGLKKIMEALDAQEVEQKNALTVLINVMSIGQDDNSMTVNLAVLSANDEFNKFVCENPICQTYISMIEEQQAQKQQADQEDKCLVM